MWLWFALSFFKPAFGYGFLADSRPPFLPKLAIGQTVQFCFQPHVAENNILTENQRYWVLEKLVTATKQWLTGRPDLSITFAPYCSDQAAGTSFIKVSYASKNYEHLIEVIPESNALQVVVGRLFFEDAFFGESQPDKLRENSILHETGHLMGACDQYPDKWGGDVKPDFHSNCNSQLRSETVGVSMMNAMDFRLRNGLDSLTVDDRSYMDLVYCLKSYSVDRPTGNIDPMFSTKEELNRLIAIGALDFQQVRPSCL